MEAYGEADYTVRATGERIHVQLIKVNLVAKEHGSFGPYEMKVAVAMDSRKMYLLVVE